jgi:hypothetical protein
MVRCGWEVQVSMNDPEQPPATEDALAQSTIVGTAPEEWTEQDPFSDVSEPPTGPDLSPVDAVPPTTPILPSVVAVPLTESDGKVLWTPHEDPQPTWPDGPKRSGAGSQSSRVLLAAVAVLVVIALVGLGALKLHSTLSTAPAPTPIASRPTATGHLTATAAPTMPNFSVPNGKIAFDYSGDTNPSSTCIGTASLPPTTINLNNSGNVAVDWWVQLTQTLPDGKTLWAGALPPYNTLPAGQSVQLQVQPDPGLCGELIGHHGVVQYTATVYFGGGTGQFTITETVTPPPPGTATPTPTLPPTPYS